MSVFCAVRSPYKFAAAGAWDEAEERKFASSRASTPLGPRFCSNIDSANHQYTGFLGPPGYRAARSGSPAVTFFRGECFASVHVVKTGSPGRGTPPLPGVYLCGACTASGRQRDRYQWAQLPQWQFSAILPSPGNLTSE